MKNILKVVFVIIGTIIGAGFASRKGNIFILRSIWNKWNMGYNFITSNNRNNYI